MPQTAQARNARVLAIGVDAGAPELIERWVADGTLPTIAAIARRGVYVRLESMAESFNDAVWPSFYTEAGPATHGYYHFRQVKPGTARLTPTMNRSHRRPFWWQLGRHGQFPRPREEETQAFLITVASSTSVTLLTPVSHPISRMVMGPGDIGSATTRGRARRSRSR